MFLQSTSIILVAFSHGKVMYVYKSGYQGQLHFRDEVVKEIGGNYPAAVKSIPKGIKVQLNSHNINDAEKEILDAYRYHEEDSLYRKINKSPYFSIMHDGISKYSVEYNGVYLRGLNENHDQQIR